MTTRINWTAKPSIHISTVYIRYPGVTHAPKAVLHTTHTSPGNPMPPPRHVTERFAAPTDRAPVKEARTKAANQHYARLRGTGGSHMREAATEPLPTDLATAGPHNASTSATKGNLSMPSAKRNAGRPKRKRDKSSGGCVTRTPKRFGRNERVTRRRSSG